MKLKFRKQHRGYKPRTAPQSESDRILQLLYTTKVAKESKNLMHLNVSTVFKQKEENTHISNLKHLMNKSVLIVFLLNAEEMASHSEYKFLS